MEFYIVRNEEDVDRFVEKHPEVKKENLMSSLTHDKQYAFDIKTGDCIAVIDKNGDLFLRETDEQKRIIY